MKARCSISYKTGVQNAGFDQGATSMKKVTIFVGLDYHQSGVQVCLMDRKGNMLANGMRGNSWEEIAATVPQGARVQAAIEACCGAADLAEELIAKAGWSVSLAHPGYVARMKQSPDKSDFTDAQVLAELVRVGYLPRVWLAPAELRDLRRLVRRQQLVQDRRSTKLRIRALLRDSRAQGPAANAWTKVWLEWLRTTTAVTPQTRWIIASQLDCLKFLEEQIRAVEKQLAEVIKEDRIVQEGGRRGTGDRCHLARGNRPLPEPAQRLQRRASSGCRTDQGRQRAIARGPDRNGSPVDHLPRTMDAIGPETSAGTQAGKCDCCSHRQPLGALVASPHDLARIGLLNVSTNPSTKA
jgi:hypothetical protein